MALNIHLKCIDYLCVNSFTFLFCFLRQGSYVQDIVSQPSYVVRYKLKLLILLPLPKPGNFRHVPPYLVYLMLGIEPIAHVYKANNLPAELHASGLFYSKKLSKLHGVNQSFEHKKI